jgi:hypothetical protein
MVSINNNATPLEIESILPEKSNIDTSIHSSIENLVITPISNSKETFTFSPNISDLNLEEFNPPIALEGFSLKINNLTLNRQDENVQNLLKNTRQIFVGYEFLHFPSEDLESKSIFLNESENLSIEFEKCTVLIFLY